MRDTGVGRPPRDLQLSYRLIELRSIMEQPDVEQRQIMVKEIEWRSPNGDSRWLDLQVSPLSEPSGSGSVITCTDVTVHRRLQRELEQSHQELDTASRSSSRPARSWRPPTRSCR